MILHRLEFEAFMAYPDRQTIDFGDLNAAGVFLLNGPTGAGKTTILDAICYALYGGTTGDRDPAQLYSTRHAATPRPASSSTSPCRAAACALTAPPCTATPSPAASAPDR